MFSAVLCCSLLFNLISIYQQTYCGRTLPYDVGQPMVNGGYYYSPSGETGPSLGQCREESVAGTPYTYHNGLAMFTSDTGQLSQLSQLSQLGGLGQHGATLGLALQQLPSKGAASQSPAQPFPLLYGPGGATTTTAMFLPSGSAASLASLTQHQLQLQSAAATAAHINNVAAAVQSQVRPRLTSHLSPTQWNFVKFPRFPPKFASVHLLLAEGFR